MNWWERLVVGALLIIGAIWLILLAAAVIVTPWKRLRLWRKALNAICYPALVLVSLAFVVPLFIGRQHMLNASKDYIDVHSGRYRYEHYLLGIRVYRRTEETEMSKLYRQLIGDPPQPEWEQMNHISLGYVSGAHTDYTKAACGMEALMGAFRRAKFSEEAKRLALTEFLDLLDRGYPGIARSYGQVLEGLVLQQARAGGGEIGAQELRDSLKGLWEVFETLAE